MKEKMNLTMLIFMKLPWQTDIFGQEWQRM